MNPLRKKRFANCTLRLKFIKVLLIMKRNWRKFWAFCILFLPNVWLTRENLLIS